MAKDVTKDVVPAEEPVVEAPAEEVVAEEPKVNVQKLIDGTVRIDY